MLRFSILLGLAILIFLIAKELVCKFRRVKLIKQLEEVNETIECHKVNKKISEKTTDLLQTIDGDNDV